MKMQKTLFALFFLVILVVACDQNGLGVGAAFKNLITLPIQGAQKVANLVSGKTYDAYREKTMKAGSGEEPCLDPNEGEGQLTNLSKVACQCKPWANCRKELCSCEKMCPENFNIFKRPNMSLEPTPENTLAFVNSSSAFKNNKMTQGYCWGHAAITQRFNRLGFFNMMKRPQVLGIGQQIDEAKDPEAWKSFYSDIIDKIASNEASEIPGFADLGSFSSHPVIQEMIADKVAGTWADNAMSFSGLSASLGTSNMKIEKTKALIKDLKERLSYNQSPQLIMTSKESAFYTHVVLVSGVKEMGGETRICLNDNNYTAEENKNCQSYLRVQQNGQIVYPKWWSSGGIGTVEVTTNEDTDTVKQVAALVKYCRGKKDCEAGI